MSLLDALLNEPYRDPREIWIAQRADGQRGSGTIDDPYDGGVGRGPPIAGDISYDEKEVVVASFLAHQYRDGQWKTFSGVVGPAGVEFNKSFPIEVLSPTTFKFTLANVPGVAPSSAFSTIISKERLFTVIVAVPDPPGNPVLVSATISPGELAEGQSHGYIAGDKVRITAFDENNQVTFDRVCTVLFPWVATFQFRPDEPGSSGLGGVSDLTAAARISCILVKNAAGNDLSALSGVRLFWPVAKVDTGATRHGYVDYEAVSIASATGLSAPAFNDDFVIIAATEHTFRFRFHAHLDAQADLQNDLPPTDTTYPQKAVCAKIIHRFDERMRAAPSHALIHLGPGKFATRGSCSAYISRLNALPTPDDVYVGFRVKTGQRLVGSGIGATTVKIVFAVDPDTQTYAIGGFGEGLEASDFTVDANQPDQRIPARAEYAPVACCALSFGGNHLRIQRVRAIRFGTQSTPECNLIFMGGWEVNDFAATNNVEADCIVEQPSENNVYVSTLIDNGGHGIRAGGRGGAIRHCYMNCEYSTGTNEVVGIQSIVPVDPDGEDRLNVVVTTRRPHRREKGQLAVIRLIEVPKDAVPPAIAPNGVFRILERIDSERFRIKLDYPLPQANQLNLSVALIGAGFQGPKVAQGSGCVVEGNFAHECNRTHYADAGTTGDLILRDNYFSNALYGVNHDFNPDGSGVDVFRAGTVTYEVTPAGPVATFETANGFLHNLSDGQIVTVAEVFVGDPPLPNNPFNGSFAVKVVSPTKFTYVMKAAPVGPPIGVPSFATRWETRRLVIENNIIEVYPTDENTVLTPQGVSLNGFHGPPFVFPGLVIRGNLIRHTNNVPSVATLTQGPPIGLRTLSVDRGIIEGNIIDVENPHPIQHPYGGTVRALYNHTFDGTPLAGLDDATGQKDADLHALVEDAILLAL